VAGDLFEKPCATTESTGFEGELYQTTAHVLIPGLGADELFACYTRHSTAFIHHGYGGLINELEFGFQRFGERNLGGDNRVMSHLAHRGKELRYSYPDEDFIRCTLGLKVGRNVALRSAPRR
jgi:asparagine synthetase B (glutamine-hydrolysing)